MSRCSLKPEAVSLCRRAGFRCFPRDATPPRHLVLESGRGDAQARPGCWGWGKIGGSRAGVVGHGAWGSTVGGAGEFMDVDDEFGSGMTGGTTSKGSGRGLTKGLAESAMKEANVVGSSK